MEIEDRLGEGIRTLEQEESVELHLMKDHYNKTVKSSDSFLTHLTLSFLKTDLPNFEAMIPLIRLMITKYEITCTCADNKVTKTW